MPIGNDTLEMWGGVECTVNRVGDTYFDQLELTGHAERRDDIDRIAALGVRTVRYPLIWERTLRDDGYDWRWSDDRLAQMRSHGITPVLGLVHHGSGPRHTSLLDPDFVDGLAEFAGMCAKRYPWIEMVTPVNEPLTTARFSGLYGLWYPHSRSDRAFARMLLIECQATRAAMRAIRATCPAARLVQTEDLGHTHSTELLRYQAKFENERRWLTFDLLSGRITRFHPMHSKLVRWGLSPSELQDFVDDPCPPDIIGVNYYVTSERYLDHRLQLHPPERHGGNRRHAYADVEAARACPERRRGLESLLVEAWERYEIPIVVTEVHLSCADEAERLRWIGEAWSAALNARERGCDVRAITAWALFGLAGWDTLVTAPHGRYETGIFDASGTSVTETECARMIRALATTGHFEHDALAQPGWWHERERRPRAICAARTARDDPFDSIGDGAQAEPLHSGLA